MATASTKKPKKITPDAGNPDIIIIGAGIVGVSTALELQRKGLSVTLIDKTGPAEGASYGNGGVLASCSVVPVTTPGLIGKAPRMLLDPGQPLFLKWSYLPRLMPWLWKYLKHANAEDTKRIARALLPIIGESLGDHQTLAKGTGAEKWITPCDYLYVYNDRSHFEKDSFGWQVRRENGFSWTELEGEAFYNYDPAFDKSLGFAACLGQHGRITSPGDYVKALAAYFVKQGGRLLIAEVEAIEREAGQVTGVRAGGETLKTNKVAITTGIWSGPLVKQLGLSIPMEAERGYHLELWGPNVMPKAPVMVASGKFVATPMEGRIRLAGVVEFGGTTLGPSQPPFDLLEKNIRKAMPQLTWQESTSWLGFRPAPSDSIPLIGELDEKSGIFLGFGHHHVGLTGGPKTGRLLAQIIAGQTPNLDMAPYSPSRFR